MTDEEIVLYFNEHRLAKLESYLLKDGSSVEHELQNLLDRFYEQIVPEHERMEVEAQIELEREREAAQREASRRFAVVHFHEGDDDFFFTSELRNSFYSIANLYRSTLKDEVGKYTLDSIAQSNFSGCQTINDMTFSVLCSAMPNDPRITALVEFDFNHNTISVCESSGNAWRTYDLKDVSAAMYKAERKEGLSLDARHEIFAVALEGKEITFDDSEDESPDLQMKPNLRAVKPLCRLFRSRTASNPPGEHKPNLRRFWADIQTGDDAHLEDFRQGRKSSR